MGAHTILLIGSLDTKGEDYTFLKSEIEKRGFSTITVDVGVLKKPSYPPDIPADQVAEAGGTSLEELRKEHDRGKALEVMQRGVAAVARRIWDSSTGLCGVISLGGGGGTALGTSAMRELPMGVPKVMVSTLSSGDTSPYVQVSDIIMFPSIVDVSGVNRISRTVYTKAASAVCAMADVYLSKETIDDKPLIAASMFGNTTTAVNHVKELLGKRGYEVIVFHATGTGGKTMEALTRAGNFTGILDITTTELADEVCGGELTAGRDRMSAAAESGFPQVVTPACVDMCNFWALETVPEKYRERKLHSWNPNVTLMRTNKEENIEIAHLMAENLNKATAPVEVYIPLKGFSELDIPGGQFWDPDINNAFIKTLKENLRKDIPIIEMDNNINDPLFSASLADAIEKLIEKGE